MIEAICITAIICIELVVSAAYLTRVQCYQCLKTDPDNGSAIFAHAMYFMVFLDIVQLVYFVYSREDTTKAFAIPEDAEIELLLQEIEDTPVLATDDAEAPRKKLTKPMSAILTPGFGRVEGT
jgi:hypothetical protein